MWNANPLFDANTATSTVNINGTFLLNGSPISGIGGTGTTNTITKFTGTNAVGNSAFMTETANGISITGGSANGNIVANGLALSGVGLPCVDQYLAGGTDYGIAANTALSTNTPVGGIKNWSFCDNSPLVVNTQIVVDRAVYFWGNNNYLIPGPSLINPNFAICTATLVQGSRTVDCGATALPGALGQGIGSATASMVGTGNGRSA